MTLQGSSLVLAVAFYLREGQALLVSRYNLFMQCEALLEKNHP